MTKCTSFSFPKSSNHKRINTSELLLLPPLILFIPNLIPSTHTISSMMQGRIWLWLPFIKKLQNTKLGGKILLLLKEARQNYLKLVWATDLRVRCLYQMGERQRSEHMETLKQPLSQRTETQLSQKFSAESLQKLNHFSILSSKVLGLLSHPKQKCIYLVEYYFSTSTGFSWP